MERIRIKEESQRDFIDRAIGSIGCPTLRDLLDFGISTDYSSLKNYYTNRRLLPKELFFELCTLAGIKYQEISYEEIDASWGQKKGGEKSKRGV